MDLGLKLAPERRLIMTFALRQALDVLQMSQLELGQWLCTEIERNPLLELYPTASKARFDAEIPATITLHDHLLGQIRDHFSFSKDQTVALSYLELLDERGFIPAATPDDRILLVLQTLDPPGIFARSLQETFLIQLKRLGKMKTLAFELVQNCFDDLLHGRYAAIKKKLGTANLAPAIQILARLALRPANTFRHEPVVHATPDLQINRIEGGWTLELIEDDLPKFHIQTDYLSLDTESEEEKDLLQGFKTSAKWVFRSLNRRRKLLREIGRILIRKQKAFLDRKGPLASLTIKDLSEKLQVHESTLSRALSGKYASTPRGILPLRAFLSTSPQKESAREILEKLIRNEDKQNPLTDEQLAKALKAKGFSVARRTIAKYRTQLKIGSAAQRKNLAK